MAISFSRPDPSSPAAVSEASFGTARRGFDQQEVREFLRMVAAELARLQEREKFLERELRGGAAGAAPVIDEETATRLLGEEAVRILQTARESAGEMRTRAEEGAAQLLRDATEEASRRRQDAELEASRRRSAAAAEAEAELAMAKQQGREMVEEARSYRERVLGELARRRELARHQIEVLIEGRDRLVQEFERARLVAVEVMAQMTPLREPDGYADAVTGDASSIDSRALASEVAATRGDDAPAADDAPGADGRDDGSAALAGDDAEGFRSGLMYDQEDEPDEPDEPDDVVPASFDHGLGAGGDVLAFPGPPPPDVADHDPVHAVDDEPAGEPEVEPAAASDVEAEAEEEEVDAAADVGVSGDETTAPAEPTADVDDEIVEIDEIDEIDDGDIDDVHETDEIDEIDEIDDDAVTATDVDALFARLRAAAPDGADASSARRDVETIALGDDPDAVPAALDGAAETPFQAREAVLVPLIVGSARKLKRVLADEQNEVLDALRRNETVWQLDALLPDESEHAERYVGAIASDLEAAADAGAASTVGADDSGDETADDTAHAERVDMAVVLAPVRAALAATLVAPLRERLARSVEAGAGDNDDIAKRVRTVYREWKSQRIDEHLDDPFRTAYARGGYAALAPGTPVRWIVDPDGPSSPDCEDNSLAGAVPAGETFPTGHVCAPAHPGCRCLVAVVDD